MTTTQFGVFIEISKDKWEKLKKGSRDIFGMSLRRVLRDSAEVYSAAVSGDKEALKKAKDFLSHKK